MPCREVAMRRVSTAALLLGILCGTTSTVRAQDFPDFAFVTGGYDGSALQLEIRILWDGYRGAAVALDVYRSSYGLLGCGPEVRITDQPVPYPGPPYPASVRLTDAGVSPGTGYFYEARLVDARRNPVEQSLPIFGSATTGVALLAQAKVYFDRYGGLMGYWLIGCPQACMPEGPLESPLPNDLMPYVDTDTTLLLYGEVVDMVLAYNFFSPRLRIDHAQPAKCVVEIAPSSWSSVKHLYR